MQGIPYTSTENRQLALKGRYDEALRRMDEVGGSILRTLKLQQLWASHMNVLKLRRSLFRFANSLPSITYFTKEKTSETSLVQRDTSYPS